MKPPHVLASFFVAVAAIFFASLAAAADPLELPPEKPGQADLDKAMQLQLSASKLSDFTAVITHCEAAEKKGLEDSDKKTAQNLLASALQERGCRYADIAITHMVHDPRDPEAAKEPAMAGTWQDDRKAALADLERSVQLAPKQPKALFFIARLNYLPEGNTTRAAEALDKAIDCSDDEARLKAEALLLRANTTKDGLQRANDLDEAVQLTPGETGALRARAAAHADQGKLDAALDDLDKALEIDPKDLTCYQLKSLILANQHKLDEAAAVLEKARALLPSSPDVLVAMARVAIAKGDAHAAVGDLDKALVLAPKSFELRTIRAELYRVLGDRNKLLAEIDKMLELRPGQANLMRDRAVLLSDLNRRDEAIAQFEKLLRLDPHDALTQMQLGLLYTAVKKYHKAVELLSSVVATHPDEWKAYRTRADAYLSLGERGKALADYNRAFHLHADDVNVLNNLAWVLATAPEKELRDGDRAVALATDACRKSDYKTDYVLSTLAAAYAEQGNFDDAQKWAKKAIEAAGKEHSDELNKQLEFYAAKKPWREDLREDKQDEKKNEKDTNAPDATKPPTDEKPVSSLKTMATPRVFESGEDGKDKIDAHQLGP